ncbi:hypothetical protein CSIRO_1414 [Bradyrhizobiaceae bacterium SG-6C]|nr:hypothetical protein CSIRO_1414 [Bradyrhizobiaceae bacterium SG-6C]
MLSSREAFENDVCPVGDEMLGSLYRASEHGLPQLVESVSADVRAMLALFCYKRAHLHGMSLAIAATCTERDLVEQGGIVGSTLFAMSREAPSPQSISAASSRRSITLSTKPLSTLAPLVDEIDDEEPAADNLTAVPA